MVQIKISGVILQLAEVFPVGQWDNSFYHTLLNNHTSLNTFMNQKSMITLKHIMEAVICTI